MTFGTAIKVLLLVVMASGGTYFLYRSVTEMQARDAARTTTPAPAVVETAAPAPPDKPACVVTRATYERIRKGMTRAQVRDLIGCAGTTQSDEDTGQGQRVTFVTWTGKGGRNATVTAMFRNDRLNLKSEFNLE